MTYRGITTLKSPFLFGDTVRRLLATFENKDVKVFAIIDQQAEAQAAGMAMPPTTLIIFGNPKSGTPLMLADPQVGLDLPLKVLVCEPEAGQVVVIFTAASEIIKRYALSPELLSNLAPAELLIAQAVGAA